MSEAKGKVPHLKSGGSGKKSATGETDRVSSSRGSKLSSAARKSSSKKISKKGKASPSQESALVEAEVAKLETVPETESVNEEPEAENEPETPAPEPAPAEAASPVSQAEQALDTTTVAATEGLAENAVTNEAEAAAPAAASDTSEALTGPASEAAAEPPPEAAAEAPPSTAPEALPGGLQVPAAAPVASPPTAPPAPSPAAAAPTTAAPAATNLGAADPLAAPAAESAAAVAAAPAATAAPAADPMAVPATDSLAEDPVEPEVGNATQAVEVKGKSMEAKESTEAVAVEVEAPQPAADEARVPANEALETAAPSLPAAVVIESNNPNHFGVGETGWMQNPYFKDGTRLRIEAGVASEFSDQHILNDSEVVVLEVTDDRSFARVRASGEDVTEAGAPMGWVRMTNISRIERREGLQSLEQLAELAMDELEKREGDVLDLQQDIAEKDAEIAALQAQLDALRGSDAAAPAAAPSVDDDDDHIHPGERGFMLNPYFLDGTRLRLEPQSDSDFLGEHFVLNDAEVEVLEVEHGFSKIREVGNAEGPEGWVRSRNLSRFKRSTGLMGLKAAIERSATKKLLLPLVSVEAAAPTGGTDEGEEALKTEAAGDIVPSASPGEHIESQADGDDYKAAAKAKALDARAEEIAHMLGDALALAHIKTMELFRDWDSNSDGQIDRKEFHKAMGDYFGSVVTKEELDACFNRWDGSGSGVIEYKDLDFVLRSASSGGKGHGTLGKRGLGEHASTTAKELHAALRERLQGKKPTHFKKEPRMKGAVAKPKDQEDKKAKPERVQTKARKAAKKEEEVEESNEQKWTAAQWLQSLSLHEVIASALELPEPGAKQYNYVRKLERVRLEEMLTNSGVLPSLCDTIIDGVSAFAGPGKAMDGVVSNDKFQTNAKFQMTYGSLSLFYGGLESLLGPPKMLKGSLLLSMESEHVSEKDSEKEFTTSNGVTSTSKTEWEIVLSPKEEAYRKGKHIYPERRGFREQHPEWCRVVKPIDEMLEVMEAQANALLRKEGHSEMIKEELVGGRLYTGPMYAKYNTVLRSKSKDPYLMEQMKALTMGNNYTTTIHAINSCVIKMSKLTKAGKVWRGIKDAKLPRSFWVANSMGVRGGIEYGFSSTTTDKSQAVHYAVGGEELKEGNASTVFEMQMGMVDRGADLGWISQYPHEREVLLPPLTGIEALDTNVSGGMLVINARLSLNMAAHTLEQVLSRRRKMLMDMVNGIALELRDVLDDKLAPFGVRVLQRALDFGALKHEPDWFNDDDNFASVMSSTLHMQHELVREVAKLHSHNEKTEISFKGWKELGQLGSRSTMLSGWVIARSSPAEIFIDLRDAKLDEHDGRILADALQNIPRLTSLDVRGNPKLAGEGVAALIHAMKDEKPGHPRSLCGVTPGNTRLEVPRKFAPGQEVDVQLIVGELECHLYSESVTAGMGGAVSGDVVQLNRRGGGGAAEKGAWQPLVWAAKVNHLQIAEQMLKNGTNVNVQEAAGSHSQKFTALHMASYKGHLEFVELLLKWNADPTVQDVNGQTAKVIAEKNKKGSQILELIKKHEKEFKSKAKSSV